MKQLRFALGMVVACSLSSPVFAAPDDSFEALSELPLEQLGSIVISVSKKPEDSFKAAAAITVISQEDIKLSGATHVAEVLRMVPGLQVARSDAGNWAISSRGFNDSFANKLLVVVDGRTVYTPLFSGVYWDIQDVVLEDIERIEVIRGPGATLWGANAVNGVINIITKRAEKTQGTYVSQLIGTQDKTITEGRYGGSVGDDLFYRAYAKYSERRSTETTTGENGNNDWDSGKAGFRADYDVSSSRKITVQGDIYDADADLSIFPPTFTPPYFTPVRGRLDSRGANLLGRWTETHGEGIESSFQAYYDFQSPSYPLLQQNIHTFDFDYQTSWSVNDRHHLVWGAGYRLIDDDLPGTPTISFAPQSRITSLLSAFGQDTITLVPKTLDLTVGSKFEKNDYTGFEMQPNARLSWYPTANQTVWTSVARAVRTPSRSEDDVRLNAFFDPVNGVMIQQFGDRSMESEVLNAYEAGYRIRVTPKATIDAAAFYNVYDDLRTFELGAPFFTPDGVVLPAMVKSLGQGTTRGVELTGNWDVTARWSLQANYSYIDVDTKLKPGSSDILLIGEEQKAPKNQFNIRSQFYITDDIDMTNTVYYVDKLPYYNIDEYVRFDTRLGWKATQGVEVALVGQNLFDNGHQEFGAPLHGQNNEIERNLYAKVTFRY